MRWVERSPREVAALMLDEVFADEGDTADLATTGRAFPLTDFQEAAARRATAILRRWGGVLIADSVGLGKTFIALALIEEELRAGRPVLVTIPAALRSLWRGALRRLRTHYPAAGIHLLSHAQLSRGSYAPTLAGRTGLVVVDEAHRFRNPRTRRHAALLELAAGARVALLTATPVNNGVADLYHLLRLFAADDAFVSLGIASLAEAFEGASGPELRRIVREVVVRRTRSMVRAWGGTAPLPGAPVRFPSRAEPRIVRFDDPRVPRLATGIAGLELAPYGLATGVDDDGSGGAVAALVRLGLLKRLESGAAALAISIQRQLAFSRAFLTALESGRLLRPGSAAGRSSGRDVDPLQLVLFDLVAERCPPGFEAGPVASAVRRDVDRLQAMRRLLEGPDPKLDALRERLASLAPEKVVVFTEFRDTAAELWQRLATDIAVARIDGGGAWLGGRSAGRRAVVERFAPRANAAAEPPARERVDVLIVTDVLSEGANLQDARHVVSYDLPWNPVRLLQRIGRVDRLGSPHAEVVPHIFLPAAGLEEILGLTNRLRHKIGAIAASIGDEDGGQLFARLQLGGAEAAAAFDLIEARDDDPMESLRLRWRASRAGGSRIDVARDPTPAPGAVPISRVATSGAGRTLAALATVRFRGRPWLVEVDRGGEVHEPGQAAARLLGAALAMAAPAAPVAAPVAPPAAPPAAPCTGQARGEARKVTAHVRSHFQALEAAGRAPRALHPREPAARLAHRLRRAIAAPGVWAQPGLVARADRALRRLDAPITPRVAARTRRLAAEIGDDEEPAGLLDRLEDLFAEDPAPGPTRGSGTASAAGATEQTDTEILAILLVGNPPRAPVENAVARG